MAVAVQLGDALFLTLDMPFAVGHRLLGNSQVSQLHLSLHMLCSVLRSCEGYSLDRPQGSI
jgi:hypothetical protein